MPDTMPRLKGYRFPREIVAYAVWSYHRFALSTGDVEDLLAERGVIVSRETVRQWVNRFGRHFAACIKRDRPAASDKLAIPRQHSRPGTSRMGSAAAVRRTGALSALLNRRDTENLADEAEPFADRASGLVDLMAQATDLHPITRACMGFNLWSLAGLGQHGDRMEAAVSAARIAASEGRGAVFAPLAMAGQGAFAPVVHRLSV